ncbi:MAG: hypothetical protein KF820_08245 [Candidatus Paracaedibacteraceae bacterium]|nr:hypothetical protein [Candidatus Paracaedibacteraceae bacterium]
MLHVLMLLFSFLNAYDESDTLNHIKFDFFYKVQFVPQEVSERPRLPVHSLVPVVVPTLDYHLIQRANIDQRDLDYWIWFYKDHEEPNLEATALHRKLLQPGEFTIENLRIFKEAVSNMFPVPRCDLMKLTERTILRLKNIQ